MFNPAFFQPKYALLKTREGVS
uniref:Uncharacterized protein n=1 Tax=Anguilla anguilla TaxID=7936 RepID=A0A0E9R2E9_ANGAN